MITMNRQKEDHHPTKMNKSQKQYEETWLGNPDDHEPTKKVEKSEVNP